MNQNGVAFTYDDNGNVLSAGSIGFTYTPQNQLETAGSVAAYAYDADDQRVKKIVGTSTTYFIRGPNGQVITEWTDPGTVTGRIRDYIYLGTRLLSAVSRTSATDPGGINVPRTKSHRFATSWQSPSSVGTALPTVRSGILSAARKSSHPNMPFTGLRLGLRVLVSYSLCFLAHGRA